MKIKMRYNISNKKNENGKNVLEGKMDMLYEYLKENYKLNEPIFMSDIDLPVSDTNLRQMFKILCDVGKIKRYDTGIYYLSTPSKLNGGVTLAPGVVVGYKYVARKGKIDGYYSGFTFANQMGLTTQVPYAVEIVTNAASANVRQVTLKGQKVILRKPKTKVTKQNYKILQFLDLLKDIDIYADNKDDAVSEKLIQYVRNEEITQEDIDRYISLYPDKVYRNLYEMRIYHAFA